MNDFSAKLSFTVPPIANARKLLQAQKKSFRNVEVGWEYEKNLAITHIVVHVEIEPY